MLHELVFALRGNPGLIFTQKEETLCVNPCLTQLHPCEVVIINQLLRIASDYRYICQFIKQNQHGPATAMYLGALCQGLDNSLDSYRSSLVQLERELLRHPTTQVSQLQHKFISHGPVLHALVVLIRRIKERQHQGCILLDTVYKASGSCVDGVAVAMKQVLRELHCVLYKQLLAWLLQGNLYDPYQEFFIVKDYRSEESILVGEEGEHSRSKSHTYRLEPDMVPDHISPSLAEKIFFIGQSIQMFESDRRVEVQGSVLQEREAEFYQELARLRDRDSFVKREFAAFVDTVRETVSGHLHHLLLVESSLLQELDTAWQVFLLGRGELFHTFIKLCDERLRGPPTPSTQHEVNQSWLTACRGVLSHSEEENMAHKVQLVVGSDASECWGQLTVQLAVPWPLHLVITPAALNKYNKIFSFLLLLRRTETTLQHLWSDMMLKERLSRGKGEGRAGLVLPPEQDEEVRDQIRQTRLHITFIVSNIQSYILSDVLETEKTRLTARLAESTTYESVMEAHEQFLAAVSANMFLLNPRVLKLLKELLYSSLRFSAAVSSQAQNCGEMCEELNRRAGLVLQLLASLRQQLQGRHLAQLLLRLDYNRYFSRTEN